jgi:hypothetical protein
MKKPMKSLPCFAVLGACLLLCGCKSTPSAAYPEIATPAPVVTEPVPPATAATDDMPASASPLVRAHLIKLREMRDLGQISEAQYQSRRAMLLRP